MTRITAEPGETSPHALPRSRSGRRYLLKESRRVRRILNLSPVLQLAPGLGQYLLGRRGIGAVGLAGAVVGAIGVLAVIIAFAIDRRIGFGWATQERPLTIVLFTALGFGLLACAVGVHLAFTIWRERPDGTRRPWLGALVVAVAFTQLVAGGTVAYYANVQREFISDLFPSVPRPAAGGWVDDAIAVPPPPPREPVTMGRANILVLGGDAGEDRWGLRPDSISVVSIDLDTAETTIIGIPRNLQKAPFVDGSPLWGHYPNGYNCGAQCLISYLYTYASLRPELYPGAAQPGVEATRDAVEGVLGIELHYAVLMDMQGFADLIDAIGGIDLCVPEDIKMPIGIVLIEAGCRTFDGEEALAYARTRSDSDDYTRMTRQREVQQALLVQADPLTVLQNFQSLTETGAKYIYTDIPQDGIGVLLDAALRGRGNPAHTIELVPPSINSVNPPFDKIRSIVTDALADE